MPPIDYSPRHPQPVTLPELRQLEPELLTAEVSRLQNSIQHLEQSNVELGEFAREARDEEGDSEGAGEMDSAREENEGTIAAQRERITMIRLVLEEKIGVDASNPHYQLPSSSSSYSASAMSGPPVAPSSDLIPSTAADSTRPTNGEVGSQVEEDGMYL
ncbi:hypothetical protein JCM11641_003857 [Rhodosporidiobolus odoratus]